MLLKDKTIVITGATKGIGRTLALACAAEGANVVISGRDQTAGTALQKQIEQERKGRAVFCAGDLCSMETAQQLTDLAVSDFGRLDGLVNYAGTVQASAPLGSVSAEMLDSIMNINFKSSFYMTQAAVSAMKAQGGSIVFMGSLHAKGGEIDRPAYACSKGAVYTLFSHVANQYAARHIRSNWVTIGWVATPGEEAFRAAVSDDKSWKEHGDTIMPMGRLQRPEDYIGAVLYLLSDAAEQTTGSEIVISGGLRI